MFWFVRYMGVSNFFTLFLKVLIAVLYNQGSVIATAIMPTFLEQYSLQWRESI